MGKKWVKDGTKRSALNLRLSEIDMGVLEGMAVKERKTISEMTRILIREGAKSRSFAPAGPGVEDFIPAAN